MHERTVRRARGLEQRYPGEAPAQAKSQRVIAFPTKAKALANRQEMIAKGAYRAATAREGRDSVGSVFAVVAGMGRDSHPVCLHHSTYFAMPSVSGVCGW